MLGFRLLPSTVGVLLSIFLLEACSEENKSTIGNVNPEEFPTMLTTDVSTLVSDSGYTRYHLTTDIWKVFDEAVEPHWTFPDGLFMERYDNFMNVESTFRSDSAIYYTVKKLWSFNGDVRMKNIDGDRFATEQLFWDQQQKKVFSDSFIHIERSDRILEGYGFVSNEEMTEYTILNVSGIFPTPERKERKDSINTIDTIGNDSIDGKIADKKISETVVKEEKSDTTNLQNKKMNQSHSAKKFKYEKQDAKSREIVPERVK